MGEGGGGRVREGRAVGEGDVQEEEVDGYHEEGLEEEGGAVVCAEPVVDSVVGLERLVTGHLGCGKRGGLRAAYLRILLTSMMSGMSSEKPADVRARWIE